MSTSTGDVRPQPYNAAVGGFAAAALVAMLGDRVQAELRRLAARGVHSSRIEALARCWASLLRARDEWVTAEAAATAAPTAATLAGCGQELSTASAAAALGVTDNRVRQMCRSGQLAGRRVRGRWHVDAAAVRATFEE